MKRFIVALSFVCACFISEAKYLVDTGLPDLSSPEKSTAIVDWRTFGATFDVSSESTLERFEVFAYFDGQPGTYVQLDLHEGSGLAGEKIYSEQVQVIYSLDYEWKDLPVSWHVMPGTYTMGFRVGLAPGVLPGGVPNPAIEYWLADGDFAVANPTPLNFGLRVTSAVPEPATYLMMLLGLAGLAAIGRVSSPKCKPGTECAAA